MTVKKLKEKLEGIDENMKVLIPFSPEFDGAFYTPCSVDSGISAMGTDPHVEEEDIDEMKILNKPIPEEEIFLLVPCGFYEEKSHTHELN